MPKLRPLPTTQHRVQLTRDEAELLVILCQTRELEATVVITSEMRAIGSDRRLELLPLVDRLVELRNKLAGFISLYKDSDV